MDFYLDGTFFSDFVDDQNNDDWLPLGYTNIMGSSGSPAYPHACSNGEK